MKMSQKDKWVRRFSVDETSRHKNGFTMYKITSVLFPIESPETMTVVSVWKRYSDVQRLHKNMRVLHAGLHLRGSFPSLTRSSYFKRFQQEVIEERAKTIKTLLEFIADHKLLFTSTDFVNFLQTGYPEPETSSGSIINAIRSSLHLPIEETPPLEYQTSDDETRSPAHSAHTQLPSNPVPTIDETDFSQIPIYEAADVEIRQPSPKDHRLIKSESFESINSLDSISSDLYNELDKISVKKSKSSIKKTVLPDLIIFDAPSTSGFEDYHTMPRTKSTKSNSETTSLNSTLDSYDGSYKRSSSRVSMAKSVVSLSNVECKTKTEDSYVFEAGYVLNLATRYEDMKEYDSAFECYKAGIEKMLIGVKSDPDPQRRALIKRKINKYLSYAEAIYKDHLSDAQEPDDDNLTSWFRMLPERAPHLQCPPISMLRRPYSELSQYRVLAILGPTVALVLHSGTRTCRAMKVLEKVPHNLTEFDEYILANTEETRQPVLPTVIPYMVPLHSYVETNNLIFLILSYAPGEKLFDYIKNYANSIPNTPAREVNLENVFAEPKIKPNDVENDNIDSIIEIKDINVELKVENKSDFEILKINENIIEEDKAVSIVDRLEQNIENNNRDIVTAVKADDLENLEVNDLVINSQKLLLNVDKVLKEVPKSETSIVESEEGTVGEVKTEVDKDLQNVVEKREDTPPKQEILKLHSPARRVRDVLPATTICKWGAEILTALESLHNSGVVCIDLNPSNILLGDRGQIILTYMYYYPGLDMRLSKIRAKSEGDMYIAPELYRDVCVGEREDADLEAVCDYWSFGAIMYWLICGVPLSRHHRSLFTSHTILQLPETLPLEEQSLLTQLLTYEPSERLGGGKDGIREIKSHPYFKNVKWWEVCDGWIVPD